MMLFLFRQQSMKGTKGGKGAAEVGRGTNCEAKGTEEKVLESGRH